MKTKTYLIFILVLLSIRGALAQNEPIAADSLNVKNLNEVIISAPRADIPLKEMPAAVSIVSSDQLNIMTKGIAPDEALRLVPGVRVDNGTGGSRVHLYIRGQGVLSESGFRGLGIMVDGISVNDPGGYAPDLYDVDWNNVKSVEVIKGLAASMYGSSATGGVVNIITENGCEKPVNVTLKATGGSNGFWKTAAQLDGTKDKIDYRISYSHTQGNGYRIHQAFKGDNFSEKLNWKPSDRVKITQILSYTNYFNQNSEGINLGRYDTVGHTAANTDAIPFNELHLTQRLTGATIGKFDINENQNVIVKGFFRLNNYRETSNNGDDYKPYVNPGASVQYNLTTGKDKLINHISVGADFSSQTVTEHMFGVDKDINRVDTHFGQSCIDKDTLLVNQIINQKSAGGFFIDRLDINQKLFATLNVRYDYIYNQLTNNIPLPDSVVRSSGNRDFQAPTFRFGIAYDICQSLNVYANVGTGFLTPTNNELYNNPAHWGGFNETIVPSTSLGEEFGIRGEIKKMLYYNVTIFNTTSENEFYRYSIVGRGNNTAFYGNVGGNRKLGQEIFLSFSPVKAVVLDVAYTHSDFKYTTPDSVEGHWIPQCPQHVLTADVSYTLLKNLTISLEGAFQSKWCIQVDDSIYNQFTENDIKRSSWVDGFTVFSANISYKFKIGKCDSEVSLFAKNLFDEQYFGFTEPNNGPDYNSFQPAPGREFFGSLKVRF